MKKGHRLPASWRYDAGALLWLFRFARGNGGAGRIVGEARDPQRRTATFFCLDEATGRPLWEGLAFDEPWWVGIEGADGTAVYFHRYRQPDMPQHQGIMRVDLERGALLWDNREHAFVGVDGARVVVARRQFEGFAYAALDAATGRLLPEVAVDEATARAARARGEDPSLFAHCAYPEPFDPADPAHAAAAPLLEPHLPAAREGVELLLRGGAAVAAWHSAAGPAAGPPVDAMAGPAARYDQHLAAVDLGDGSLLFAERINRGLEQPMIDSFMAKDGRILFVSERRTLTAYPLLQEHR